RNVAFVNSWTAVTYGNGMLVAVALSEVNGVMTSTSVAAWESRNSLAGVSYRKGDVYGNGMFVVVSSSGSDRVTISSDGVTWKAMGMPADNDWNSIAYGNGRFVAVATMGTNHVMTSGSPTQTITPNNNTYQGGMTINGGLSLDGTFAASIAG